MSGTARDLLDLACPLLGVKSQAWTLGKRRTNSTCGDAPCAIKQLLLQVSVPSAFVDASMSEMLTMPSKRHGRSARSLAISTEHWGSQLASTSACDRSLRGPCGSRRKSPTKQPEQTAQFFVGMSLHSRRGTNFRGDTSRTSGQENFQTAERSLRLSFQMFEAKHRNDRNRS